MNRFLKTLFGSGATRPAKSAKARPARLRIEALEDRAVPAVFIQFDYSRDITHPGPDGRPVAPFFVGHPERQAALEYAAKTITSRLTDNLAAIAPPGGGDSWTAITVDPASSSQQQMSSPNLYVPQNVIVIYAGGTSLAGTGNNANGYSGGYSYTGGAAWGDAIKGRGNPAAIGPAPTAFAPWGGSVQFDTSASTNWNFHLAAGSTGPGQADFVTVAEHEIGHVLGYGSALWQSRIFNGQFYGPSAVAAYGGPVPAADGMHWAPGVRFQGQLATMVHGQDGGRHDFSELDFAGLQDIGWNVAPVPAAPDFTNASFSMTSSYSLVTSRLTVIWESDPAQTRSFQGYFINAMTGGLDAVVGSFTAVGDGATRVSFNGSGTGLYGQESVWFDGLITGTSYPATGTIGELSCLTFGTPDLPGTRYFWSPVFGDDLP